MSSEESFTYLVCDINHKLDSNDKYKQRLQGCTFSKKESYEESLLKEKERKERIDKANIDRLFPYSVEIIEDETYRKCVELKKHLNILKRYEEYIP